MSGILKFSIAIFAAIVAVFFVYSLVEKKRKKDIQKKFRNFSHTHKVSKQNLRNTPRITIPKSLDVILTLTDNNYFGFKALALDVSLSGFSVKPDFPLKKLPVNTPLKNVLVATPINTIVIKEIKTVRIEHHVEKRLLAFHIESMDEDQSENLRQFVFYLDEFIRKKQNTH